MSIGLLNELKQVEEALDGKYIVVYPVSDAPLQIASSNRYTVIVARQPNGRWRAIIPLLHRFGEGDTQEEAEQELVRVLQDYLRERTAFIRDADPLVERFIVDTPDGAVVNADDRRKGLPVWRVIDAMSDALAVSGAGDDTPFIDPERIADIAAALELPVDAVRAAVAYYLEHKPQIRNQIAAAALARVNDAFARLESESGLSEDELSSVPDDAPHRHDD